MSKVFKFYDFEFNDSLSSLLLYLKDKEIKYNENKAFVSFNIPCTDCEEPVEVIAYYKNDSILHLVLNTYPTVFSKQKAIEAELNKYYEKAKDNVDLKEFQAEDFSIFFKISENVQITVEFSPLDKETKRRIRNQKLKYQIPFISVGAIISAVFITLYFCFKGVWWLHIVTSIFGVGYAIFELYYMYIKHALLSKSGKKAAIISAPIGFVLLFSFISFLFVVWATEGDITSFNWLDYAMVIVYLLPSFHLLILILVFILSGL